MHHSSYTCMKTRLIKNLWPYFQPKYNVDLIEDTHLLMRCMFNRLPIEGRVTRHTKRSRNIDIFAQAYAKVFTDYAMGYGAVTVLRCGGGASVYRLGLLKLQDCLCEWLRKKVS